LGLAAWPSSCSVMTALFVSDDSYEDHFQIAPTLQSFGLLGPWIRGLSAVAEADQERRRVDLDSAAITMAIL